nr:MAG TPA: hypothetical protein [Caudoviricetes sp.]
MTLLSVIITIYNFGKLSFFCFDTFISYSVFLVVFF